MKKDIRVYGTRIEIEPYEEGENYKLEKMCSARYDYKTKTAEPLGYRIEDNKIIIPRGISLAMLSQSYDDSIPTMMPADDPAPMSGDYRVTVKPKDETQVKAISFLLGLNEFSNSARFPQLALNLDTGLGKTYCTVYAILAFKTRTLIILHQDSIREQWINTFLEKTTMPSKKIHRIIGMKGMNDAVRSRNKYDVHLILHSTLCGYIKKYGPESLREWFKVMQFGLKVVDEAHLNFRQTIDTDFCSNVTKSIYLTATMTRSSYTETGLFERFFANTMQYGENVGVVKNVVYNLVYYNSNPTYTQQSRIYTYKGVSIIRWADYAFKYDRNKTIYIVFFKILKEAMKHEGRIMVMIPKIEYCETIARFIREEYPDYSVGTLHSKNTKEVNERVKRFANIIVTTIASSGTGTDIKFMRSIIVMEPYASQVTARQMSGRLREYEPGAESYVYELVDSGFEAISNMVNKRIKPLKDKCKKVQIMK